MDLTANISNDSNDLGSTGDKHDGKKQQFTRKQRMDMYAFCVLELELHGNTVSIKKQQQAIKKLLKKEQEQRQQQGQGGDEFQQHVAGFQQVQLDSNQHATDEYNSSIASDGTDSPTALKTFTQLENQQQSRQANGCLTFAPSSTSHQQESQQQKQEHTNAPVALSDNSKACDDGGKGISKKAKIAEEESKTLLQLQQEIATNQRCYSDYQKTQVLTSKMLREVQKRFAKYYPDSTVPSRTTIKHVFEKCVEHGTVDNVKNPRKATKIPQGDEVQYLLIHEPQLSLRQMAQRLNVSTGTVSRRCQALGLIPESVTIKHQQMATARRQKQIKELEKSGASGGGGGKATKARRLTSASRANQAVAAATTTTTTVTAAAAAAAEATNSSGPAYGHPSHYSNGYM